MAALERRCPQLTQIIMATSSSIRSSCTALLAVLSIMRLAAQSDQVRRFTPSPESPVEVAQTGDLPLVGRSVVKFQLLQGIPNPLSFTAPVREALVFDRPASYIQVEFDQVVLPEGSFLEIESLADGHVQRIDGTQVRNGRASSAYFNGFAVRVRLWAAPGSAPPKARVCELDLGEPHLVFPAAICGQDDRVLTATKSVCRLLIRRSAGTYVCTGWLVSPVKGGHVSAGHCVEGAREIWAQYNVPLSTNGGNIVNPAPYDQYPVRAGWYLNAGVGQDWAVFEVQGNPFRRQLRYFVLANPSLTTTYRIRGYGTVESPTSPTWGFAQKGMSGRLRGATSTSLSYVLDATGGDSGGPIYYADDRGGYHAVGIHTHGGCTASGGANYATSVNTPNFRSYYNAVR